MNLKTMILFHIMKILNLRKSQKMKINRKVYDFQEIHPNQKVSCVCERDIPLIAKIRTYDFGDAAKFNNDITRAKYKSNPEIEHHIKMILLHFFHIDQSMIYY